MFVFQNHLIIAGQLNGVSHPEKTQTRTFNTNTNDFLSTLNVTNMLLAYISNMNHKKKKKHEMKPCNKFLHKSLV